MLNLTTTFSLRYQGGGTRNLAENIRVIGDIFLHRQILLTAGDNIELELPDGIGPGSLGRLLLINQADFVNFTASPSAPTVAPQGTGGAATWTYKIVARQSDGAYSAASGGGSTAVGNATLTTGNFNRITWPALSGADGGYAIYRTAHGSTPSTNGLIGSVAKNVLTFDDTGLAGNGGTAPSAQTQNTIQLGGEGESKIIGLRGEEFAWLRWDQNIALFAASTGPEDVILEYYLFSDL